MDANSTFESIFHSDYTVSAWVKPDDGQPADINVIFGTQKEWTGWIYFQIETNGKVKFVHGQAASTAAHQVESAGVIFTDGANDWKYLTGVLSLTSNIAGTMTLYVNGISNTADSTPTTDWNVTTYDNSLNNINIGTSSTTNRFFNGSIDEIRLYDRALSAPEILKNYKHGKSKHS